MSDVPTQPPIVFDPSLFTDPASAARALHAQGVEPVFVVNGGKRAIMDDWLNVTSEQVIALLDITPTANVGMKLGYGRGLLDIDLDSHWARLIMPRLLERFIDRPCPCYGRVGREAGHFLAQAAEADPGPSAQWTLTAKEAEAIKLPEGAKRMLLEVRSKGNQSVAPSSKFDGGDVVGWVRGGEVPRVERARIDRIAALCAVLSVIAFKYPRTDGDRNEVFLALTGALIACEWLDDEDVDWCVELVAGFAGDEKRKGRAADTRAKMEADEDYWGLPKLCELLGIGAVEKPLRKWITWGQPRKSRKHTRTEAGAPPADAIFLSEGRLIPALEEAEAAMMGAGVPVFVRSGELVSVRSIERGGADKDQVKRELGARIILPAGKYWLTQQMCRASKYSRFDKFTGEYVYTTPALDYAEHLRQRAGSESPFRPLRAVRSAPTMRPDGSILNTPGYDEATGILYEPIGEFPAIPEHPTKRDALLALSRLIGPYCLFPFVDDKAGVRTLRSGSLAVVLSAEACIVARPAMSVVPMHLFDAPEAGTGKTKLTECVGITGSGCLPAVFDHGADEEEFEKRLGSSMLKGDPVIVIDNIEGQFGGPRLCSTLTSPNPSVRVLGKSKQPEIPNTFVLIGNGNNILPRGDLPRRCVRCRIDAQTEEPDKRAFAFDPVDVVRRTRAQRVVDHLTILRAYILAGRPLEHRIDPMGSFEDYSLVRGALVWLGMADPLGTRAALKRNDAKKQELGEVLKTWHERYGSEPMTLADLRPLVEHDRADILYRFLCGASPIFSAQSAGVRLHHAKDRRAHGHVLRRGEDRDHAATWVVEPLDGGSGRGEDVPKGRDFMEVLT